MSENKRGWEWQSAFDYRSTGSGLKCSLTTYWFINIGIRHHREEGLVKVEKLKLLMNTELLVTNAYLLAYITKTTLAQKE